MSLDIAHCGDNQSGIRGDHDCTQQISAPRDIESYNKVTAPGQQQQSESSTSANDNNSSNVASRTAQPHPRVNWLSLDSNLLISVFLFAPTNDLIRSKLVCKLWYTIAMYRACWVNRTFAPTHFKTHIYQAVHTSTPTGVDAMMGRNYSSSSSAATASAHPSASSHGHSTESTDASSAPTQSLRENDHEQYPIFNSDLWLPHVVQSLRLLECMSLAETHLTDIGVSFLCSLPFLHSINLSSTRLTDVGLTLLCNTLPHMKALNLCDTLISDTGLIRLSHCKSMKSIAISCNDYITRHGWAQIAHLPELSHLDITAVDNDRATIAILNSIMTHDPPCSLLTRLSIHAQSNLALMICTKLPSVKELQIEIYSEWHDYDEYTDKLTAATEANEVTRLLRTNNKNQTQRNNLLQRLKPKWQILSNATKVQCLSVPSTRLDDDDILTWSQMLWPSLKSLHVDLNSPKYTDKGLEYLSRITQLTEISLAAIQISDNGMKHISTMPNLHTLSISRGDFEEEQKITDLSMTYIASIVNLEGLRLAGIQSVTDRGILELVNAEKFTKLVVERCNNIGDDAINELRRRLPQVQAVKFQLHTVNISQQSKIGVQAATQPERVEDDEKRGIVNGKGSGAQEGRMDIDEDKK